MSSGRELIFVYGTWRNDASEAAVLGDLKPTGFAMVDGCLYRKDALPLMTAGGSDGTVAGQLFILGLDRLAALDQLSSAAGPYVRRRIPIAIPGVGVDEDVHAWAYLWEDGLEGCVAIPSGDWLDAEKPPNAPVMTLAAAVLFLAAFAVPVLVFTPGFPPPLLYGYRLVYAVCGVVWFMGILLACRVGNRKRERWPVLRISIQSITLVLLSAGFCFSLIVLFS